MKTHSIRSLIISTVLALTSLTGVSHAQTMKATANVPFMFEYNGHTFASGAYSINARPDGVVEIGRSRHVQTAMAQPSLGATATASSIVFHRAGNKYYLREIYTAGSNRHLNFMESRGEKQAVEFEIAANPSSPSVAEIVVDATR